MTSPAHNLSEVTPVLSDDGLSYVGYIGRCTCGWSTPLLPKDDAWEALGDHVAPRGFHARIRA
jgi:hypothetical protein